MLRGNGPHNDFIHSKIVEKMFDNRKTRMIELPTGEETMTICYAVSIEYRNATDGQTDGQTELHARQCADAR